MLACNEVLEWLKALGPFLLAVVVAYVTWRFQQWQVRLEKEKLRHQLYDRRFVIYKAFQKLLIALVDKPDDEIKAAFQEATIAGLDALFLLPDPGVQAYLKELQKQVLDEVIRNIMFFEGVKPHPELMNDPEHIKERLQLDSPAGSFLRLGVVAEIESRALDGQIKSI